MNDDFVSGLKISTFFLYRENFDDHIDSLENKASDLLKEIKQAILNDSIHAKKHCLLWQKKILNVEQNLRQQREGFKNSRSLLIRQYQNDPIKVEEIENNVIKATGNLSSLISLTETVRIEIEDYLKEYFSESNIKHNDHPNNVKAKKNHLVEKNIFNGMPIKEVKDHFEQLCILRSKENKEPFLSNEQLDDFIKKAFIGDSSIDKIKMNKGVKDGKAIQSVFLSYWNKCKLLDVYRSANNNLQSDYLKLLTENFYGFDFDMLISNFHKQK